MTTSEANAAKVGDFMLIKNQDLMLTITKIHKTPTSIKFEASNNRIFDCNNVSMILQ